MCLIGIKISCFRGWKTKLYQNKEVNKMIPYHKIYNTGKEIEYMNDCLMRGQPSGDGIYTRLVEELIQIRFKLGRVFMTTSATHALEMAMLLIGLKPDDEVIMPSFTFSSTANAVLLRGAVPVFADIDIDTLNLDADDVKHRITGKTKAIIPVHYAGVGCDMDRIMELAESSGFYVVEDAAQAVNALYKGKYLGGIGHMGCYSFHGTKNYTCGEGGALVINIEAPDIIERAERVREKGTDRSRFLRGEVDRYSWADTGSSYSPSEVLMAMLYAQLEQMDAITEKRRRIHEYYAGVFGKYVGGPLLSLMRIPHDRCSNYHIFYLLFRNEAIRNKVKSELHCRGISALTHYVPLHGSPMGRNLGYRQGELPRTELAAGCMLRLPLYPDMSEEDMNYIGIQLAEILEEL